MTNYDRNIAVIDSALGASGFMIAVMLVAYCFIG